jgi:predicted phosphodiesterase
VATPLVSDRLGFISDVHGNFEALEAVLDELGRNDVTRIYAAGDHLIGGDRPLDVWRRMRDSKIECARGIGDAALASIDSSDLAPETDDEKARASRFAATQKDIGELVLMQLRSLPERIRIPLVDGREVVVVHGSPADAQQEIGHDLSDEEILALVGDDPADVVMCGASHVAFRRDLEGVIVVGVGSVGASPEGRFAHYAILTPRLEGPEISQSWVEY